MEKKEYRPIANIVKEGAKIVHKNFSGRPDQFRPNGGKRSFSLVIDNPEDAEILKEEGWYIKQFKKKNDTDDVPDFFLPVTVSFDNFPPKIYVVTKDKSGESMIRQITEDEVGNIDDFEIDNVDLTIRPYCWDVGGKSGVSAYLKTMYVTLAQDDFAYKYASANSEEL